MSGAVARKRGKAKLLDVVKVEGADACQRVHDAALDGEGELSIATEVKLNRKRRHPFPAFPTQRSQLVPPPAYLRIPVFLFGTSEFGGFGQAFHNQRIE